MRSSRVISGGESEEIVMDFEPGKFPMRITQVVRHFRDQQEQQTSDFRMDKNVKETTGVSELEKQALEQKIEERALEKLKDIQQDAYKEGYDLGRDDGKKEAFDKHEGSIIGRLESIDHILLSIENLKTDLISFNETHIMKTLTLMASRLAMKEFEINPESIMNVLRRSLELSQAEENVTVRVSESELEFIEKLRVKVLKESDPLSKIHMVGDVDIKPGGCVIESNYGLVDATIDERLNKLWEVMDETMPAVKDSVGDNSGSDPKS